MRFLYLIVFAFAITACKPATVATAKKADAGDIGTPTAAENEAIQPVQKIPPSKFAPLNKVYTNILDPDPIPKKESETVLIKEAKEREFYERVMVAMYQDADVISKDLEDMPITERLARLSSRDEMAVVKEWFHVVQVRMTELQENASKYDAIVQSLLLKLDVRRQEAMSKTSLAFREYVAARVELSQPQYRMYDWLDTNWTGVKHTPEGRVVQQNLRRSYKLTGDEVIHAERSVRAARAKVRATLEDVKTLGVLPTSLNR